MDFQQLEAVFSGELFYNSSSLHQAQKMVYATDASVYQEQPLAVAIPRNKEDIKELIRFANQNSVSLIPRAAGTSLAGQVVGNGIVVDISKYFKKIIEINAEERWVRLEPGIIRDDLNAVLRPYGLLFAPETSTASRAMIGGMIGNNSCGLHSIVWGDTRQHLLEVTVLLSNGEEVVLKQSSLADIQAKAAANTLEGRIYRTLFSLLNNERNRELIRAHYPKKSLKRRNTGYALDILADAMEAGNGSANLCHLIAGSEGTLAFVTEARLNLLPLPPARDALVCIHCSSLAEALHANNIVLRHQPMASELVDRYIMDFTKGHPVYQQNRFFIEGAPEALLMVEFMEQEEDALDAKATALIEDLKRNGLGYAYPVIKGPRTKLVWDIRKAGLGLIRNMPGDEQPVNLIEDCAVSPEDLPAYIEDLQRLLKGYGLSASYYAHAGAGELHVEPMINLKTAAGKQTFRDVLKDTVVLVKKYNGSLSGEHGDGRLRGEFIASAMGGEVYHLLQQVKDIFDPGNIFNAGKIVNTPKMNEQLRYDPQHEQQQIATVFDYSRQESVLRLAEKCSGSGDCRKSQVTGGTMCPSYMATLQEKDTTRARANILRQFLTSSTKENPFDHPEIKEVMDLCLSCKACKSECPSSVDIAKLKAEFLQHYYDANGVPFRAKLIAGFTRSQRLGIKIPAIYNAIAGNKITSGIIKRIAGFAPGRSLPAVGKITLRRWFEDYQRAIPQRFIKNVFLFCDEFTNYNDVEIGKTTIKLLNALGYGVEILVHRESGRTYLSKGLVRQAQKLITENVTVFSKFVTAEQPLVGIEPSALLTYRDEALDLVPPGLRGAAQQLAGNSFLIEEFLANEYEKGYIAASRFTGEKRTVKLHGHCYQKSFGIVASVQKVLNIPVNYYVETIPSGCCGMAGSFGYEKEHYEVSMKVGELVLLPAVRAAAADTIIAASGTSCRHQIKDGAKRHSLHPVEVLWEALK
ncbi:FAD-binding and (Fe-S)-binding domain-containing protein [Niabella drilacis]|uniref:FAD/FMN-containing dehydrogenase n=1 Tax=Niabella drilacis (strain DSM 25811 / CCM 8410 / CCUG 62505 / LMG 26954 / E90) TaxID=1285928 RepID=A0A1G6SGI6_NIADE|nr:FAD-binding and (Fe-S)-binding domain-containing protein [Niabella drilacis]SDD16032.1 FAD/FMN-containing dehydrogenase [Niabella drilacis]